jgi:hypothetical protein
MRLKTSFMITLVGLMLCGRLAGEELNALALEHEVHKIVGITELWPGYDPLEVPLAVFDGANTYLFRHPGTPDGFTHGEYGQVFEGRHPAVVANCTAMIGGVRTATILLDGPIKKEKLRDLAAVAIHEGFHVFQFTTARAWGADVTWLFLYPTDDAELLALRRLEIEALRRALATSESFVSACWAERAIELRRLRFGKMDSCFVSYERDIETLEGTARYVELCASGRRHPDLQAGGFPVEAVRRRAYATGAAWAFLLDRFHPRWCDGFADDDSRYLDSDLEEALKNMERSADCAFTVEDSLAVWDVVLRDMEKLRADRDSLESRMLSAPGWRLVVEADPSAPLWPHGFDPMNICRLGTGLLHTRFLTLGNDVGRFEVMGDTVLTEGVGRHPMFDGIRRVTMAGLVTEPEVVIKEDTAQIVLPTLKATFHGATVDKTGQQITIHLGSSSKPK